MRARRIALRLEHKAGTAILTGAARPRAAQQLLPTVNRFGGSKKVVDEAVRSVEAAGGPEAVLRCSLASAAPACVTGSCSRSGKKKQSVALEKKPGVLHALEPVHRLALEMALHEESERRAMDGELAALEAAWRESEEIARIADGLLQPPEITEKLDALRAEHGTNAERDA